MSNDTSLDARSASKSCAKCAQAMRLSYRETLEPGGELRVYECHRCRTTTTVVDSGEE